MKHLIHKAICWYLWRVGLAFHAYPYGPQGRYVVLMTEDQYHRYTHLARDGRPVEVQEAVSDALGLCYEIEKLPACRQQTDVSILASAHHRKLNDLAVIMGGE